MTWSLLGFITIVYIIGIFWIRQHKWRLTIYVWSAFGLAFLLIHSAILLGLHDELVSMETRHLTQIMKPFDIELIVVNKHTIMVPESTGWTGLTIGIESSTLIELSVFAGLMIFYPKLSWRQRSSYLFIGIMGTYLINLIRLITIVIIVAQWGKSAFPLAHAVIGRLLFFAGVIGLYWYLLTKPTLKLTQDIIQSSADKQNIKP